MSGQANFSVDFGVEPDFTVIYHRSAGEFEVLAVLEAWSVRRTPSTTDFDVWLAWSCIPLTILASVLAVVLA